MTRGFIDVYGWSPISIDINMKRTNVLSAALYIFAILTCASSALRAVFSQIQPDRSLPFLQYILYASAVLTMLDGLLLWFIDRSVFFFGKSNDQNTSPKYLMYLKYAFFATLGIALVVLVLAVVVSNPS